MSRGRRKKKQASDEKALKDPNDLADSKPANRKSGPVTTNLGDLLRDHFRRSE
jgi:hypothetical protein